MFRKSIIVFCLDKTNIELIIFIGEFFVVWKYVSKEFLFLMLLMVILSFAVTKFRTVTYANCLFVNILGRNKQRQTIDKGLVPIEKLSNVFNDFKDLYIQPLNTQLLKFGIDSDGLPNKLSTKLSNKFFCECPKFLFLIQFCSVVSSLPSIKLSLKILQF